MIQIIVEFEEQMDGPAKGSMKMLCECKGAETATPSEKGMSFPLFKSVQGYLQGMAVASGNAVHLEGPEITQEALKKLVELREAGKQSAPPS